MRPKMIIEEGPSDPEFTRQMLQFRRNGEWLTEHGADLFERYRGRCIAVSKGEVFVADDVWEARRLAMEKHPDDTPFFQRIPAERRVRIY